VTHYQNYPKQKITFKLEHQLESAFAGFDNVNIYCSTCRGKDQCS